jgi:hypothetical protein
MFRSLLYDHPQGLSFVLSAFTTFPFFTSSTNDCKINNYKKLFLGFYLLSGFLTFRAFCKILIFLVCIVVNFKLSCV